MTTVSLTTELCEFLRHLLKDCVFLNEAGEEQGLKVFSGYPFIWDEFTPLSGPCVMVGAIRGRDASEKSSAQIKIWINTSALREENLWQSTLNILERIRQRLLEKRVIAQKFRLEHPLKWEVLPEYNPPGCLAVITTNWTVGRPIEEEIYESDPDEPRSWTGAGDILRP